MRRVSGSWGFRIQIADVAGELVKFRLEPVAGYEECLEKLLRNLVHDVCLVLLLLFAELLRLAAGCQREAVLKHEAREVLNFARRESVVDELVTKPLEKEVAGEVYFVELVDVGAGREQGLRASSAWLDVLADALGAIVYALVVSALAAAVEGG